MFIYKFILSPRRKKSFKIKFYYSIFHYKITKVQNILEKLFSKHVLFLLLIYFSVKISADYQTKI